MAAGGTHVYQIDCSYLPKEPSTKAGDAVLANLAGHPEPTAAAGLNMESGVILFHWIIKNVH